MPNMRIDARENAERAGLKDLWTLTNKNMNGIWIHEMTARWGKIKNLRSDGMNQIPWCKKIVFCDRLEAAMAFFLMCQSFLTYMALTVGASKILRIRT